MSKDLLIRIRVMFTVRKKKKKKKVSTRSNTKYSLQYKEA